VGPALTKNGLLLGAVACRYRPSVRALLPGMGMTNPEDVTRELGEKGPGAIMDRLKPRLDQFLKSLFGPLAFRWSRHSGLQLADD
jgi:hypothetical protein